MEIIDIIQFALIAVLGIIVFTMQTIADTTATKIQHEREYLTGILRHVESLKQYLKDKQNNTEK